MHCSYPIRFISSAFERQSRLKLTASMYIYYSSKKSHQTPKKEKSSKKVSESKRHTAVAKEETHSRGSEKETTTQQRRESACRKQRFMRKLPRKRPIRCVRAEMKSARRAKENGEGPCGAARRTPGFASLRAHARI